MIEEGGGGGGGPTVGEGHLLGRGRPAPKKDGEAARDSEAVRIGWTRR
jgi:hypothetical protein